MATMGATVRRKSTDTTTLSDTSDNDLASETLLASPLPSHTESTGTTRELAPESTKKKQLKLQWRDLQMLHSPHAQKRRLSRMYVCMSVCMHGWMYVVTSLCVCGLCCVSGVFVSARGGSSSVHTLANPIVPVCKQIPFQKFSQTSKSFNHFFVHFFLQSLFSVTFSIRFVQSFVSIFGIIFGNHSFSGWFTVFFVCFGGVLCVFVLSLFFVSLSFV